MLDHEALALIALGFFRCHYVSLYCPSCGYVRWVTPQAPEGDYCDCPACARAHCNCGVIGAGYTNKQLPRHEVWWSPPLWVISSAEPQPELHPLVVEALSAGKTYPAVAQQFGISEKSALAIRKRAGLPGRQVHAR